MSDSFCTGVDKMFYENRNGMVRGGIQKTLVGAAVVLYAMGCAVVSQTRHAEPSSVLVRNMSAGPLSWIVLAEARKKPGQSVRLGRISPVLAGTTQGMGRPTDPPPFPLWVEVRWADAHGQQYASEVSLVEILKKATGVPDEALVFRIFPRGQVDVVLEYERP
jgi:hypothetical protein